MNKRIVLAMIAVMMLAGCSAKETKAKDNTKDEKTAVTVTDSSEPTTEEASKTTVSTTAAQTTTTEVLINIDDIPEAEQKALNKLNEKYGKDFTLIAREVQWEFIGEPIPEKKPTTYTLEDDEGRRFFAYGTEDSDEISGDNYAFPLFEDELLDHARDYIRSYTQAGKLWILGVGSDTMPFEAPAELIYEEFFSYFCEQEGKVSANLLLSEGTELPEELTAFDNLNNIYLDDFGCRIVLGVYYLPQRDYDRLEDVMYGDIYINRDHMKGANE